MKRKRKRRVKESALQKVVVSVKPRYFGNDSVVQVIESMLPPLLEPTVDALGRKCQYCGGQFQSDSGDWLLFFKTRWHTYRQHLMILSENKNSEPLIIFGCIPENEAPDFMGTYGYDIQWERIVEIDWRDFADFVVRACAISIEKWIQDNTPDRGDAIGVQGDLKWILPHLRSAILTTGEFTTVEEGFNFPKAAEWQEKLHNLQSRRTDTRERKKG